MVRSPVPGLRGHLSRRGRQMPAAGSHPAGWHRRPGGAQQPPLRYLPALSQRQGPPFLGPPRRRATFSSARSTSSWRSARLVDLLECLHLPVALFLFLGAPRRRDAFAGLSGGWRPTTLEFVSCFPACRKCRSGGPGASDHSLARKGEAAECALSGRSQLCCVPPLGAPPLLP